MVEFIEMVEDKARLQMKFQILMYYLLVMKSQNSPSQPNECLPKLRQNKSLQNVFIDSVLQRLTYIFEEIKQLKTGKHTHNLNGYNVPQLEAQILGSLKMIRNEQYDKECNASNGHSKKRSLEAKISIENDRKRQGTVFKEQKSVDRNLDPESSKMDLCQILSVEEIQSMQDESEGNYIGQEQSLILSDQPRKSRKKNKDSNKEQPKKPMTSFVQFYSVRSKELKQEFQKNGELAAMGNLAKYLSNQWNQMSKQQRFPYQKAADQSKKNYYNQKKMFEKENKEKKEEPLQTNKKQSENQHKQNDKENVKKAEYCFKKGSISSFFVFFKYNSEKIAKKYNENQRGKLAKLASEEWKNMSDDQKKIYVKMSRLQRLKGVCSKDDKIKKKIIRKRERKNEENDQYKPKDYKNFKKNSRSEINQLEEQMDGSQNHLEESLNFSAELNSIQKSNQSQEPNECYNLRYPSKSYKIPETINIIELNSNDQQSSQHKSELKEPQKTIIKSQGRNRAPLQKQPVNAFLMYYQQSLKDIKAEFQKARGSQLVKIASTRWAELSESEKQVYYDLANQRKKNYEQLMKNQRKDTMKIGKRNKKVQVEEV